MLQTALSPSTRREPPPAAPPVDEIVVGLRAELDAINDELKVLHSSTFALRAYAETWVAFVCLSSAGKLTWDWAHTAGDFPIFAVPLAVLGLAAGVDAVIQRVKQHRLARVEETQLARQRQLRQELGLDEVVFP